MLEHLALQLDKNNKEIQDLVLVFNDYMHMKKDFDNFAEYRQKILGLDARIENIFSKFWKVIKIGYLRLKKSLDFF
jgi:hypothetical protein